MHPGVGGRAARLRPRRSPSTIRAIGLRSAGALALAIVLLSAGRPPPTLGHEAGKLVVEPPVALPGEKVTIHAEALWTEVPVTITLVDAAGAERGLTSGATNDAGALEVASRLPDDLSPGTWEILVENDAGEHVEGQVVVRAPDPPFLPIALGAGVAILLAGALGVILRRGRGRQAAASSTS